MLGPLGMLAQEANKDTSSKGADLWIVNMSVLLISLDLLGRRLGSHLQPAVGAFFHVRIISFRVSAVMPIIGWLLLLRRGRGFPLNIDRWCYRHSNHWRISVIGGIIRASETIPSIASIAVTAIPQSKSISPKAIAGIVTA